ncbi:hypothetical protein FHG64_06435 [Antarcticibacterium flavum]|uniref:Uncharacterized protein n=1 Tax=Antarcticibacterium flavum TaxID=2058175 RepID=A0A5B7X2Z7_9FLAO|nr:MULTISPECIES: hypothetical protein [Antarcticibacterium]MCM4161287.1 hypothetical protein [Antarcticibacterium sp. W02-3]QCY69072.1 hypothetical protein FHG64_06435 [Antarcticibacterium flavum]
MINKIEKHEVLSSFIEETCSENGVCVSFDDSISEDSYVIIKVDKFYNSLNIEFRPPSVDCLIVRECINRGHGLTLVELKKANSSKDFDMKNIEQKFETTLSDFISDKFADPLLINYNDVKLFFVSNKEIYKRDLGLKMEALINIRFKFNDKTLMIRPLMPTPTIKNCYG